MKKYILLLLFLFLQGTAWCQLWKEFDVIKGSFKGTTSEQAKILLKLVKPCGNIGKSLAELPPTLDSIVLSNNRLSSEKLRTYLAKNNIDEKDVGGNLSDPISKNSRGISANYFVIHDTSIELTNNNFPININDLSWNPNQITDGVPQRVYRYDNGNPKAHIFVNRLGTSKTQVNFKTACRATKSEKNDHWGSISRGLFIHIEMIQPRIKGTLCNFPYLAPSPGFTKEQIKRLALLYIIASTRKGAWLIPAYHCVLDFGIPDGHDDPQNFSLVEWDNSLKEILNEINNP